MVHTDCASAFFAVSMRIASRDYISTISQAFIQLRKTNAILVIETHHHCNMPRFLWPEKKKVFSKHAQQQTYFLKYTKPTAKNTKHPSVCTV